jgi:hypothetical protein
MYLHQGGFLTQVVTTGFVPSKEEEASIFHAEIEFESTTSQAIKNFPADVLVSLVRPDNWKNTYLSSCAST